VAALESLTARGATLAICTNKREQLTRKLLEALELTHYFAGLAGRDTFPVSKPDPAHLLGAVKLAGGPPTAIMVGDSDIDFMTAKAAGIPIVMASFGYGPPPRCAERPDAVFDHYDQLESRLEPLLRG
jgi:phosphoglycolate phosphatase